MPPRVSKSSRLRQPVPEVPPGTINLTPEAPPEPMPMLVDDVPQKPFRGMVLNLLIALNLLSVFGFYVVYYRIDQQSQAIQQLLTLVTTTNLNVPASMPVSSPAEEVKVETPAVATTTESVAATSTASAITATDVAFLEDLKARISKVQPGLVVTLHEPDHLTPQYRLSVSSAKGDLWINSGGPKGDTTGYNLGYEISVVHDEVFATRARQLEGEPTAFAHIRSYANLQDGPGSAGEYLAMIDETPLRVSVREGELSEKTHIKESVARDVVLSILSDLAKK